MQLSLWKIHSVLQDPQQWGMAKRIVYGKRSMQNQTSVRKSIGSDCPRKVSLNGPPFASPQETDNKKLPPMESENVSFLVLRRIQAANSTDTFRNPKMQNV